MMEVNSPSSLSSPSFSSSLLDSIYRSIDRGEEKMGIYREPMKKKKSYSCSIDGLFQSEEEMANFQRVCMIEKWMEKRVGEKLVARRKLATSATDLQAKKTRKDCGFSSSSDSSCGRDGGEDDPRVPPPRMKATLWGYDAEVTGENYLNSFEKPGLKQKSKPEIGFFKSKSKASKIYDDLKKTTKEPISPGGKLATFLNSLFNAARYSKNPKTAVKSHLYPSSKPAKSSTSSFTSRSCLSKPPTSAGKSAVTGNSLRMLSTGDTHKQSPRENKTHDTKFTLQHLKVNNSVKSAIDDDLMVHVMEYNRRVEDAAMDFLRKTHFEDEEFDDLESCASSDLFELDNLSTIGAENYLQELPVYETTCIR